jgi:hypothetical protein
MKTLVSIFLLVTVNLASAHWLDAVAARTNALQSTWRAKVSPRFQNVSRPEVVAMMGVPMKEHEKSLVDMPKDSSSFVVLPAAFSVYEQWPKCFAYIADQGEALSRSPVLRRIFTRTFRSVRLMLGFRHRWIAG